MINFTPKHLRCEWGGCPSIHKLDDGRLLVIGNQIQSALEETLVQTGRLSPDHEQAVIISPDLLDDVEREWRTIDSAPKDGTEVLLYTTAFSGEWIIVQGAYFSSPKEIDNGWETQFGFHGEPTHWKPLPSPPKSLNEREQE